ncbi:MAG: hypothetical protein Q7T71_05965, partial [Herbiconiux sp.]|nr:hypothetical protein [Herbiconiux sp.]
TTVRRYASGYKTDWPAMLEPSAWVPPLGGFTLIALFLVVSVAFALTVVLAGRDRRPDALTGPHGNAPADPGPAPAVRV